MVTLDFFFYFMVLIFAIIGSMRGWAKEMLVAFSMILAIFIVSVVEDLVPNLVLDLTASGDLAYFWIRSILLIVLVFFGYQTPNISKLGTSKFARERLQDTLLGFMLGALNGYLIIGTLWYYMHTVGYPFSSKIIPPISEGITSDAFNLIPLLAPTWLTGPLLYVIVALAFLFVLVVLI